MASAVQTSLGKADTAVQPSDITSKENTSNKVTSLSSSSTDVQYPSAKAVYTHVNELSNTTLKKGAQTLSSSEKEQVRNNIDVYGKSETYSKTELNNLITTPNQEYVSVTATSQTTSVTDVLPATGAADTIYRVGNWDGTQYNDSVFSEYAWNGSAYIKLSTKSQIGEVYDISANHADTKYADLAAALGTNGANIPQSLRKGGMSVKFIQSSDNKYVQYRLMLSTFTADVTQWQGVDKKPTVGSGNLVKSVGVSDDIASIKAILDASIKKEIESNDWIDGYGLTEGGSKIAASGLSICYTPVEVGDVVYMWGTGRSTVCAISRTSNPEGSTYTPLVTWAGDEINQQEVTALSSMQSYMVLCKYNDFPCHAFILDSSVLKEIISMQPEVAKIGGIETILARLDSVCLKETDFGTKPLVYTNSTKEDVINKVSIANTLIKSIELLDAQDYHSGELSLIQLYYYQKTASVNRWVNQFQLTQNGSQVWKQDINVNFWSRPAEDSVVVSETSHIRIVWNARALFDAGTGSTGYVLFRDDDTSIKPSPYLLRTNSETEPKRYVETTWLRDHCVSENKLSQELIDKINNSSKPDTSLLKGKKLVTLCDSLGNISQWQTKLAQITGAIYDPTTNNNHYSYGGTRTLSGSNYCGQARAKMLVDDGLITPDVIIIENVNDSDATPGNITDEPFFMISRKLLEITAQASASDAETYWQNNFATIVGGETPAVGSVLGIPYTIDNAVKLTITHVPTSNGNVDITLSGMQEVQAISVVTTDTIQDILDKILEYQWFGYTVKQDGDDSVIFSPMSTGTKSITINYHSTGVTGTTLNNQSGTRYIYKYFYSHDVLDWNTPAKWVDSISRVAAWKGLVEYLFEHFPMAYIYWLIPKTFSIDYTSNEWLRADGSIDYDKVVTQKNYAASLFTAQIQFCDRYQIPYLDIRNETCITPANIETYISPSNVHPKTDGYIRWADVIAKRFG